jgi:hypothetical protein
MGHVVPDDLAERLPGMLDRLACFKRWAETKSIPRVIVTTMPDSTASEPFHRPQTTSSSLRLRRGEKYLLERRLFRRKR